MRRLLLLAARAVFTGYSVATAVYCMLAYLPFTYHQVHAGGLLPGLDAAVRMHPWLNLAALALVLVLLAEPLHRGLLHGGWPGRLAAGLGIWEAVCAVALIVHPVLAGLQNDGSSLAWGMVALIPPAWLAAIDICVHAGAIEWGNRPARAAHLAAAWRSAIFVAVLYAAVALARPAPRLTPAAAAPALGWSLLVHLLVFLAIFLALDWLARVAAVFRTPARVEFWLCHLLLAGAVWEVVEAVFCPAVGFAGWPSSGFAAALGIVLASQNAAAALCLGAGRTVDDGIGLAVSAPALGLVRSAGTGAAALLVLGTAGAYAAVEAAAMDWNFLLQELTAAALWPASFACFYGIVSRRAAAGRGGSNSRGMAWILLPLAFAGAYRGLEARPAAGAVLERWAGYDASFRLARVFLARPQGDGSLDRFLARNTNIPSSVHVDPAPVILAANLARSPAPPPHIFIFTIDSLRRDYLSPYNPAVTFTPAIEGFARESTVFRNAFTRYGGTGLSEPAIWAGAMLLHKQYITPFAPMNALERLLQVEQYRMLVSRDSILDTILAPSTGAVDLDPPEAVASLDFARSLDRLAKEIDRRAGDAAPIFAYTQPQNIHISVIQREGASVPAGESYPGFYAPYASRLWRVDAAFGKFIGFLKARGLYDRSIVVLTSDHGDSLGEEGRWGHAYTLFPEIVRIPLLVHLPQEMRAKLASDPDSPAFSTDITPSLYYLLGHRPVERNELFGAPLFTERPEERRHVEAGGAGYLIAASYGAVYGMLSGNGRVLYVADGVNYRRYLFDLGVSRAEERPVSAALRREQDERIRSAILSINRFYHFGEAGEVRHE
ncbi:MAG TPA: sulfatase-like hydrolase/transferase [Bryobacteraceae bacterium]|nr:membrane hypothetical protein [Candidatus Sulfopaludibacter sp. SbA4]HYW46352.1 sulfatase-like hydrolase/transferase [Bryobacteraceae bacterium]